MLACAAALSEPRWIGPSLVLVLAVSSLPDAEVSDIRSLTSGKILGRVKLAPEKGTPIEDRIAFVENWFVGSEHGLVHDGLQADGFIELRLDWRNHNGDPKVALIKCVPWLAYGCGEGARLGVRKPGATEGTSSTVQRSLRDDTVVVKRDGTDNELTVDPTPFTVVPSSNPRHPTGTRLLILHDGGCVDALVEPWLEPELDIKEGSRHHLKVEGKLISGWVTMVTQDGQVNLDRVDLEEGAEASAPAPEAAEADANAPAAAAEPAAEEGGPRPGVWLLNRKKMLAMHSGSDPQASEKVGSLTNKMPVRILDEKRTEGKGVRIYITTIPAQSSTTIVIALNEFNHSVQRFPAVAEYEAARANYLEDIVVREALVEDAITGNSLRIKDQTLHISTATDAVDNNRPIPPEWNVSDVRDLVKLLLVASPNRANGAHSTQPVLVRAGPGTGKTWMAKQAVFTLADRLLRGTGANDGIRLVPIVVFVQRIIYLLREGDRKDDSGQLTLLQRYIESVYTGKKMEAWCTMLMQAYDMRALVVLLDGVDEAAGLRDQIEDFVHKEVVPSCNRVLVTSRPEGVKLSTYSKTFIVMNLNQLTNEQQRKVINVQMEGNKFFDHLLSLGEVRKNLDDAYRKIGAVARNDLETLWSSNLWQNLVDGNPVWDPEQRQKDEKGLRMVEMVRKPSSEYLVDLDTKFRTEKTPLGETLLQHVDSYCAKVAVYVEDEFEESILEGIVNPGEEELHHQVAKKLGALVLKFRDQMPTAAELEAKAKANAIAAKKNATDAKAAKAAPPKKSLADAIGAVLAQNAPADGEVKEGAGGEGEGAEEEEAEFIPPGKALWLQIVSRTDEIYVVHEKMNETFHEVLNKLVIEVARDDDEARRLVKDIQYGELKNPIRLHEKAHDTCWTRFKDGLAEACIADVTRARVVLQTGSQIKDFVNRISAGIQLSAEQMAPIMPSERQAAAEAEEAATAAGGGAVAAIQVACEIKLMFLDNKFDLLDPTHFRCAICQMEIMKKGVSFFCEVEVHFHEILRIGLASNSAALDHYNFFRKRLKGQVPESELNRLLEEKLVFLVDATGIPVLLSLLVLIFTSGGEDLTKLPSNRIELYEIGIESAISKRLLPGGRTSTDLLIHDWLRLFNLDRSAMTAALTGVGTEKKEREHRPTRKAALSMELSNELNEKKLEAETNAANKKKASEQGANKGDKKLLNLDAKEVYEVFRHGAHYLREAAKPEVQRTELNRIELSMPKKLVDTVMMLVNANLKMLLNNRAQALGLMMLRHVAVSNQLAGRREFSAVHVSTALLVDQVNTEGLTLWLHLNKEEAGLPLTKTLEAQTELAPAQYQFKHLSFQEGLFAQHLLIKAEAGWETWETDQTASEFLNNPFMNNTCRIAAGYLGTRLAKRRPAWDFSEQGTRLSEVGLQALWLICETNEKLKALDLRNNSVGAKAEDGIGLSRMLSTSTALVTLNLGSNILGELKGYIRTFGRGLSSNKTLTSLDVSSNKLLPDGIKVVCNALRTCTAMKDLNLSYNSPGREPALAGMLQMHPTLRSVGVVEKEPTTRSERTWWLDTRAKEAIGRALLISPHACVMYCQCDVFSLTETTETLQWTSKANCDAIVLAGVLRSNSVLKTLNIVATGGEIGDYEREEIGMALISNKKGRMGYSDIYGLKEGMSGQHHVDLKDKEQVRSRRSFTLFAGLLRANSTLTTLTLASVSPEHIDVLADALSTNTTMTTLILEQPSKTAPTAYARLPVQELNGHRNVDSIDLFDAGGDVPVHRQACGVTGAILGASMHPNTSISRLKINPGGGSEGGSILEHIHRARKSSLTVLDLTNIGLGDRGGTRFFESMLAGKCPFLKSIHLGSNQLTDMAVGQLIVEVLRSDQCNISTLDLNNNLLGAPVITQAIKYNRSLTSLDIVGNPIEDDGLWQIGGLLLEPNCPCRIQSIACLAFEIAHGSDKIVMHDEQLGTGAVRLMFGVLKYNMLIKVLNLKGRGIQTSAASILAVAVKSNQTLVSIDLSNNPVSDVSEYTRAKNPSDTKGLQALATAIKDSVSIEAITLEGGTLPVDQLKGDKKVRVLDLSRKNLSFVSAIFMGTLLSGNTYMNELIVHTNDLTPNGVTIIVKQLQPSLKTLDIANVVRVEERSKGDKKADKKAAGGAASRAEIPPKELEAMWSAVTELGWLEKLTMDRDHLMELPSLGKLLGLKTLSMSNNKLASIPEDIGLIKGLKSLTLHGNQLSELNAAVGDLEGLEKLDLRSNKLLYLPTTISKLRNLKQLDVSENQLQAIDFSICDLHTIEKAEFKDNPLVRPPAAIARQGIGAMRKYFQEIVTSSDLKTYGARCVLIGHQESGKTALQRSLRWYTAGIPLKPAQQTPYESTNHLSVEQVVLGEGMRQVLLSIWDVAGLREYAAGIQQYITDNCFYIFCVPCISVNLLKHSYTEYVTRWLDYLTLKAPNAIVIPVLTKCDTTPMCANSTDRSPDFLANAASAQVAWFNEQLDAFASTGASRLRVQRPIQCVSTVAGGESSIEGMRGRLEELLYSEPPVLPQIGQTVTRTTFLTCVYLRALRDGREPIDSARAADIGYIPSTMSTEQKLTQRPYISFNEALAMYLDEFVPALKMASASEESLKDTVKLMASVGELASGAGDIIFLQTGYLTRILKPLTDPRMGNRLWQSRALAVHEALRRLHAMPPLTDWQKFEISQASEWLEKTGEIREELLPVLWEPLGVRRDDYRNVVTTLAASGLLYLSENTQHGRRWHMPMRQIDVKEEDAKYFWNESISAEGAEILTVVFSLGKHYPPSILDHLLAACGGLGKFVAAFKNGVHINTTGKLPGVRDVLLEMRNSAQPTSEDVKEKPTEYELSIECCGQTDARPDMWKSIMHLKKLAQHAIDPIPGLAAAAARLTCPGCRKQQLVPPTTWAVEDVAARAKTCEACNETTALNGVALDEFTGPPLPLLIDPPCNAMINSPVKELKFCADKLRFGKPMDTNFSLHTLLGLADTDEVDRLRIGGENSIIDEFIQYDEEMGRIKDETGWSDLHWLRYIGGMYAEKRVNDFWQSQMGKPLDVPNDVLEKQYHEAQENLKRQAKKHGFDDGRDNVELDFFVKQKLCVMGGLNRAHLLALRLFTSRMGHKVNMPLHDGCAPKRRHPYPALVILLSDALWKLRNAQIDHRKQMRKKVVTLQEAQKKAVDDDDDETATRLAQEVKDADVAAKALDHTHFWHGVSSLAQSELKQRGCSSIAFLSMTKKREDAEEHTTTIFKRTAQVANAEEDGENADNADEDTVFLPLAPGWKDRQAGAPASATVEVDNSNNNAAGSSAGMGGAKKAEVPVLYFKVMAGTDETTPADLTFISTFPAEKQVVYTPGAFLELGKVFTEQMQLEGDWVQYKTAEVHPTLGRNLSAKVKSIVA